jgi:predicted MFS family arabinose efflux permease
MIIPVMPTLWLVSTNYYYLLGVQCISGLVWAGFSLSASNFVFDLTPPERRATLMAAHNVLAASAVFVGAVIGGFLGTHLPNEITLFGTTIHWLSVLYGVFLISGLMRLIVAIGFLPRLEEVRQVRPMSMTGLIFRVTRFAPVSGLIFEIVGTLRRRKNDDD